MTEVKNDYISGFKGSFDYNTISGLAEHLREVAGERASGGPGDANYDPELLCLLTDAAEALEKLNLSRNFEKANYLQAMSTAESRSFKIAELESEIEQLRTGLDDGLELIHKWEADARQLDSDLDKLLLRARAILMWVPKDDANRKWIEEFDRGR